MATGLHSSPAALKNSFESTLPEFLELLRRMVELESPSDNKASVDRLGAFLAEQFESAGGRVQFHPAERYGNHLQADFPGQGSGKSILLLGHFDTVWPLGTLKGMPFKVDNERAWGPGVLDMKAGITMMLFALRALRSAGAQTRPVTVLLDTDEEVGSESSRATIERVAAGCEAVLVLEPAQGLEGKLKTSRKGVGDFRVEIAGKASHAGVDFDKGHSAVVELSRQILEMTKLVDRERGITVNPGVIGGGTRTNVVAAEAWTEVDVRIARAADAEYLQQKFAALRAFDPECSIRVTGGVNRPPMERTEGTVRLFRMAQGVAAEMGMALEESSTGGGSDGNFTSALGIATLDGLGGVGEGAHAIHESVLLTQLPRRTALLAGLLQRL